MGEISKKGSVTELSSIFSTEEAKKASKRVNETILEYEKEVEKVGAFLTDNNNLINLVHKLPHQLNHHIMVPFGKAAFFPGRLVHTNEFLVLLGEGYYADRTSKQTVDILKRRGKTLEAQVESLKAVMQDLKAEASFFDWTAAEVAEGLVEIREDYIEDSSAENMPKTESSTTVVDEDEYARLMSRFDELEKEELAAETGNENDENEDEDEDDSYNAYFEPKKSEQTLDHKHKNKEGDPSSFKSKQTKEGHEISKDLQSTLVFQQDLRNQAQSTPMQVMHEEEDSTSGQGGGIELVKPNAEEKASVLPAVNEKALVEPQGSSKAFTGSIVEHAHNLREQGKSSSKSTSTSKRVSRFKMQRG